MVYSEENEADKTGKKDTKVVNKSKENFDIYIGRGSQFGNSFSHKKGTLAVVECGSRKESIILYEKWILGLIDVPGLRPPEVGYIRKLLTGSVLGCFCKPKDCHGDVLVKICSWNDHEVLSKINLLKEKYREELEPDDLF